MASAKCTARALHPANLHLKKVLFPPDPVQSRLPNPHWLGQWLDKQINFDAASETRVAQRTLHNLSLLLDRSFATVQELNCYRKERSIEIAVSLAAANSPRAT